MIDFLILDQRMSNSDLGYLPGFLSVRDSRPAKEQIDSGYRQHGGWMSMKGFTLSDKLSLLYPGDPPQSPWAQAILRDEVILVYPGDWVLILQTDGSFEVSRID